MLVEVTTMVKNLVTVFAYVSPLYFFMNKLNVIEQLFIFRKKIAAYFTLWLVSLGRMIILDV